MKIIFPTDNGTVAVMAVNPLIVEKMSLLDAAKRYVPAGKPFKLVNDADLPDDDFQEAWVVDFTSNDGTGGMQ